MESKKIERLLDVHRLTAAQEHDFASARCFFMFRTLFGHLSVESEEFSLHLRKMFIMDEMVEESEIEGVTLRSILRDSRNSFELLEDNQYLQKVLKHAESYSLSELYDRYVERSKNKIQFGQ